MARKRIPSPIDIPFEMPDDLPIVQDNQELMFTEEEVKTAGKNGVGAVVVHHVVTFLQVVLSLGLLAWSYVTFKSASFLDKTAAATSHELEAYVVESQMQRIDQALRVYEALNEKYPVTLEILVEEGYLVASDLRYPRGASYSYQRFGEGFKLEAPVSVVSDIPTSPDVETLEF